MTRDNFYRACVNHSMTPEAFVQAINTLGPDVYFEKTLHEWINAAQRWLCSDSRLSLLQQFVADFPEEYTAKLKVSHLMYANYHGQRAVSEYLLQLITPEEAEMEAARIAEHAIPWAFQTDVLLGRQMFQAFRQLILNPEELLLLSEELFRIQHVKHFERILIALADAPEALDAIAATFASKLEIEWLAKKQPRLLKNLEILFGLEMSKMTEQQLVGFLETPVLVSKTSKLLRHLADVDRCQFLPSFSKKQVRLILMSPMCQCAADSCGRFEPADFQKLMKTAAESSQHKKFRRL